jgi:hypothetical protein
VNESKLMLPHEDFYRCHMCESKERE